MNKKTKGKKIIFPYVVWMWRERERELYLPLVQFAEGRKKKLFDHYTLMDILNFYFYFIYIYIFFFKFGL